MNSLQPHPAQSRNHVSRNHVSPIHASRILLLGLGNDILSDDAVGLRVVAGLKERLAANKNITVLESSEMGLALLDLIIGFETVVIVDAVQTGKAPAGFVHEIDGTALQASATLSPHFLGIGEMLAFGTRLDLSMPKSVRIFAIEVADPLTVGTALTAALEKAFPRILDQLAVALV